MDGYPPLPNALSREERGNACENDSSAIFRSLFSSACTVDIFITKSNVAVPLQEYGYKVKTTVR